MYTYSMQDDTQVFYGFPPVYNSDSKILILGSFPSVKSREVSFYYGNKQNRFWKTLSEFYGGSIETVEDKKRLCIANGIALWDIVESCRIQGSMDADIRDYKLVDLSQILSKCGIVKILCNGQKAYQLTKSCYYGDVPVIKMPSTSPANVSFNKGIWFENLQLKKGVNYAEN